MIMDSIKYCGNCRTDSMEPCTIHPLNWGYMKEMTYAAIYGCGASWGCIVQDEEEARLARMSRAEKAALAAKKEAENKAAEQKLADYKAAAEAEKTRQRLRDYANGGISKSKGARRCKGECYEGGCDVRKAHKNACSFIHADELEAYTAIFAGFGIKMVDDSEFLALVKLCDKTEETLARNAMKRDIKMLDDQIKDQMKGRKMVLWVTGVDENGEMKFSRTNPEVSQHQQMPQRAPFQQKTQQSNNHNRNHNNQNERALLTTPKCAW